MASIRKRGKVWRAEVYREGRRDSSTHATRAEAAAWALAREAELEGRQLEPHRLEDALTRFARDVAPKRKGGRWEQMRCALIGRDDVAKVRLARLSPADLAAWRDRRLGKVSPASVAREMNLLRTVLELARREWGWLRVNPIVDVRRPPSPASRKRRVTEDEIERVVTALGYEDGPPATSQDVIALAWLFAIETAMRASEILGLRWSDIRPKSVSLGRTKNGDSREVPLSSRAREIIALMPREDERVFAVSPGVRDALFRRAVKRAEVANLHFHDSRAEAIWRLSKKLDVLELARVIGHRDLKSLMIYYQTSADELADRL